VRAPDIGRLRTLVAPAQEHHDRLTAACAIDAVSGAHVNAQFHDPLADGLTVAWIAGLQLAQTQPDTCLGDLVAQARQPRGHGFISAFALISEELDHGISL
jgi:hypothetical protein